MVTSLLLSLVFTFLYIVSTYASVSLLDYLSCMCGLVHLCEGGYEPKFCEFAFKSKIKLCIQLVGARLHIFASFCEAYHIYPLQIRVLSSNTKNGEI
jgi:hypothetical protein